MKENNKSNEKKAAVKGKAKGVAAAAENSSEKIKIDSTYKYVDKKSNK